MLNTCSSNAVSVLVNSVIELFLVVAMVTNWLCKYSYLKDQKNHNEIQAQDCVPRAHSTVMVEDAPHYPQECGAFEREPQDAFKELDDNH